ncbi:hypothetical protein ACWIG5_22635 [Streptomyces lydicus]
MPPEGQVKPGFWEGSTPARRRFAADFNKLTDSIPLSSEGSKARRFGIDRSTLSCYRRARRLPSTKKVKEVYAAALRLVSKDTTLVPLAELLELRSIAAARNISANTSSDGPAVPDAVQMPAAGALPGSHKYMPGTPGEGDRHNNDHQARAKMTAETVTAHQDGGRRRDALLLLWATARKHPPEQVADLVGALHDQEQYDLAEVLLSNCQDRIQTDVMRIALALIAMELPSYAEHVIRVSLLAAGSPPLVEGAST